MSKNSSKTEKMQFIGLMLDQIINNSQMQESLDHFGVTKDKIHALKSEYEETKSLFDVQIKETSDQLDATKNYKNLWKEFNKPYIGALKIARIVFRNNTHADQILQLNGERKINIIDWYDQAKSFYNGILASKEFIIAMQQYNYAPEFFQKELEQVEKVYAAYLVQKVETAEAIEATETRDKKFDDLYQKAMDLKTVLKVAYAGKIEWIKAVEL